MEPSPKLWAVRAEPARSAGPWPPRPRVVNRDGELSGRHAFSGGPEEMERRLRAEGVKVTSDRVVDFRHLLWFPDEA